MIEIFPDAATLARAAAEIFVTAARQAVAAQGRFTVVLAGGSTPKLLYALLVDDAAVRARLPWRQTFFFFGDERHVPPDHADSNYRMAFEAMLSKAPIEPSQILRITAELGAAEAAAAYEHVICDFFQLAPNQLPRFDLVLLGMGPDGHTASLFPDTDALAENQRLVVANRVQKLKADRITMTFPPLNNAGSVMFMVQGPDKAPALRSVLQSRDLPPLPAQRVQPRNGTLRWLVDDAAAAFLDRTALS
jgi:6-phosphogluconolactonase